MSPISVHIEIPSYLKKYLIANSSNKKESLIFPRQHDYNLLLIRLVNNYKKKEKALTGNTVKIRLPFNNIKDVYFYNKLSYESRLIFKEQVKRDFYYDFHVFIKDARLSNISRRKALRMFCSIYDISDDDINLDSLYRIYSRFLQKKRISFWKSAETHLKPKNVHFYQ